MWLEILDAQWSILLPALLAGIVVLSSHVPLGQIVLQRGIIFLDLAIAQLAALGLIVSGCLGFDPQESFWQQQIFAIIAAVLGASALYRLQRLAASTQEAVIGILFVCSASLSILLLSKDLHGGEHLKELLVGQILWVQYHSLIWVAAVYALIIFILLKFKSALAFWFYPLFAIAVTLSTQLVGVYLVFASLIIPALVFQTHTYPRLKAFIFGVLAYAVGLILAAVYDLPAGASIVCSLSLMAALCFLWRTNTAKARE